MDKLKASITEIRHGGLKKALALITQKTEYFIQSLTIKKESYMGHLSFTMNLER